MKKDYSIWTMRVFQYVLINGSCKSYSEVAAGFKDSNRTKYEKPFNEMKEDGTFKKNIFDRYVIDFDMLTGDAAILKNPITREKAIKKLEKNGELRKVVEKPNTSKNKSYIRGRLNISEKELDEKFDKVRADSK